jgi:hypothetical protein
MAASNNKAKVEVEVEVEEGMKEKAGKQRSEIGDM